MLTISQICCKMENSGRDVTPRTLRNWWSKGILPKPARKRLGYGGGTETFWASDKVLLQANAAFDLFRRPRGRVLARDVIIRLWLLGHDVPSTAVKTALLQGVKQKFVWISGPEHNPEDYILELGPRFAQSFGRERKVPKDTVAAMSDIFTELLKIYWKPAGRNDLHDMAPSWAKAIPYIMDSSTSNQLPLDQFLEVLPFLERNTSLPRQANAVIAATDYDLITIRRIILLCWSLIRKMVRLSNGLKQPRPYDICTFLTIIGPPFMPVALAIFQDRQRRQNVIGFLLDLLGKIREGNFSRELSLSKKTKTSSAGGQSPAR